MFHQKEGIKARIKERKERDTLIGKAENLELKNNSLNVKFIYQIGNRNKKIKG